MKTRRFLGLFLFLLVSLFAFGLNASVKAVEISTSKDIVVEGAQVRTTGNAGLRFVARENIQGEKTAFGIVLAFGEAEASENFVKGGTVNGKAVTYAEVASTNEGTFMVTLYDIPESMYKQKVSARAYVVADGAYVYAEKVCVRSLAEVVIAAYEKGDEREFVKKVYEIVTAPELVEVKVNYNLEGGLLKIYPNVNAAIADFLLDYNADRKKSHTPESFSALGQWEEIDAYNFLIKAEVKSKWGWLIDYISKVGSDANKAAFEDIKTCATTDELKAADSDHIYSIQYELRGWVGQIQYTGNPNYVTGDYSSTSLKEAYETAVLLPSTYNYIEACALPTPYKEGYVFTGWVDALGNPVNQFPGYYAEAGVAEVTYTATWKAYASVNVTFDLDGGYCLNPALEVKSFVSGAYDAIDWGKYMNYISVGTTGRAWWNHVTLRETSIPGVYEVTGKGSSKDPAATFAEGEIGLLYCGDHSTSIPELVALVSNLKTGQLVSVSNIPAAATSSAAINVAVFSAEANVETFYEDFTIVYMNETELPVAVKAGFKFVGWKSSLDGQVYTEYPTYTVNPGDITYTAQWQAAE